MDWRQVWRRLREIEWRISLVEYARDAARIILAYLSTFRTDPLGIIVLVLALVLVADSIIRWWLEYRRRRNESADTTDEPPVGGTLSDEEQLELNEIARNVYQSDSEEKSRRLEEKTKEVKELSERLAKLKSISDQQQQRSGRLWIELCSRKSEPLGLSVAVKFIDINDLELAKLATTLFESPSWKTKEIEQIPWIRNISERRIVVFGDHSHVRGLTAAINECSLLNGERVAHLPAMDPSMEEDVRIVIFPGTSG